MSDAEHIEQLTVRVAELEAQNIKDREDFCTIVTQVREDLRREIAVRQTAETESLRHAERTSELYLEREDLQTDNARLRTALQGIVSISLPCKEWQNDCPSCLACAALSPAPVEAPKPHV